MIVTNSLEQDKCAKCKKRPGNTVLADNTDSRKVYCKDCGIALLLRKMDEYEKIILDLSEGDDSL